MNVDTVWDYITCFRLLIVSISSGLVSLIAVLLCLLASMVVHGFRLYGSGTVGLHDDEDDAMFLIDNGSQ